ncbi:P-loop containing nucleoside triphosphate hydrolase protein [Mycotypha africana]|uniref:P-loop containing nucleoside triphosphate hydrolase protein n=1 Tax=Mycotypha africana TaxID=64632 RepID=UPI002300B856|nr:P-loop containing nucleoside triphosphate hydrolase protein [Mycotypha africana]KAI8982046.1 P-loop containing nucleoside triphosphate hydrolase protein [Mycotypha africana]
MLTRSRSSTRTVVESRTRTKRKTTDDKENIPEKVYTPSVKKRATALSSKNRNSNGDENTKIRDITKDLKETKIDTEKAVRSPSPNDTDKSRKNTTVFQRAKAIFRRTAIPARLIGREEERNYMMTFWKKHVLNNQPGGLYISGMPGTGKTAMLNEIMRNQESAHRSLKTHTVKVAVVNCMTITEPKMVYSTLLERFNQPLKSTATDATIQQAEECFTARHTTSSNRKKELLYIVVLDEIDSLITRDQQVLYKLFEWAHSPKSRLVLIGIANALDLTDRILPRLRAKNITPELLNFNPYKVEEITEIIRDRLATFLKEEEEAETEEKKEEKKEEQRSPQQKLLFQEKAIEICARKVAAAMGDLRIALDICRQAIELVEMEQKRKVLGVQNSNGTHVSPKDAILSKKSKDIEATAVATGTSTTAASLPSVVNITVVHILKVTGSVFNGTQQKLKQLNLQHQVVLGVMLLMMRTVTKSNDKGQFTLSAFHEKYTKLCRHTEAKIPTVSRTELNDVLSLLESYSIIQLSGKDDKSKRLHLNVQESEIIELFNTKPILKAWMEEALVKAGL